MRRAAAALAGLAVLAVAPAAALTVATAPPAAAHDVLVASSPAEGAVVSEPLTVVELTFNNPVSTEFAQVSVLDAAEAEYHQGEPSVVGPTVSQAVDELPDGEYTIAYRIVSSDGHPVSGTVSFTVAGAGGAPAETPGGEETPDSAPTTEEAEPPPSASPDTTPDTTPAGASDDGDGMGTTAIVLVIVAAAVVIALVAFLAAGGRRRGTSEDTGN